MNIRTGADSIAALFLCAISSAALVGAFWTPFMFARFELVLPDYIPNLFGLHQKIRDWLIQTGGVPVGPQYLWPIIRGLFWRGDTVLGVAVTAFSVALPALKILLGAAMAIPGGWISPGGRMRLASVLHAAGRWAMADVFIVALIIVFIKAEGFSTLR